MKRIIEWWRRERLADGGTRSSVVAEADRRDEDCTDGEWIYSVVAEDGKTQLSLTLRVLPGWEMVGKDLTLHTNFKGLTDPKLRTAGAFVCEVDYETSSLKASAFVKDHVIGKLSDPHEQFWLGLELRWLHLDGQARNAQKFVVNPPDPIVISIPETPMSPFKFDRESLAAQVVWYGMDRHTMTSARIVVTTEPRASVSDARLFSVEVPAPVGNAMGRNWVEAPPEVSARVLANVLLAHALGVPSSLTAQ